MGMTKSPSKEPMQTLGKGASSLAESAQLHRRNGHFAAASEVLSAARRAFPANRSITIESAKLASAMADWRNAALLWEAALSGSDRGESTEVFFVRLTQAYRAQGELIQATQTARRGLTLYPSSWGLLTEFARVSVILGDWVSADEALAAALATKSVPGKNLPTLYAMRVQVCRRGGDPDAAETILQQALHIGTEEISSERALMKEAAEVAVAREDWVEADARWTRYVQVHGASIPTGPFLRMSRIFGEQIGSERTEAILARGLDIHRGDPRLLQAWARAACARGDWEAALARWEVALGAVEGEDKAGAHAEMVRAQRNLGNVVNAQSTLQEARGKFPTDVRLLAQEAVLENYLSDTTRPDPVRPQSQRPSAEIVVCVFNALDETKACLEAVSDRTHGAFQMTVIDDASEPQTRACLEAFVAGGPQRRLLVNEENQGYTKSANRGLRHARADWVVLLNSDAIVTEGWLEGMMDCALSDPAIRAVGPLSNAATFQSMPGVDEGDAEDGPHATDHIASMIRERSLRACPKVPMLNGFCLMLHKPTLEEIGYLDEASFPRGYGEENDLCLRLLMAGYKLAIADWVYVYHKRSASFSHQTRKQLTVDAVSKLKRLWPGYSYKYVTQTITELPALADLRASLSSGKQSAIRS